MTELLYRAGVLLKNTVISLPGTVKTLAVSLYKYVKSLPSAVKSGLILVAAFLFFFIGIFTTMKTVTITDKETVEVVATLSGDVDKILARYGYDIGEYDKVSNLRDKNNIDILIKRAFPVVIHADGKDKTVYMTEGSAEFALKSAGVSVNPEDLISVSLSEHLTDRADITVRRVSYTEETLTETIPFSVDQRKTPLIKKAGRVIVITPGEDGSKEVKVKRKLIDGKEAERTVISTAITKSPTTEVCLVGDPGSWCSSVPLPAGITVKNGVPSSYKAVYSGRGTAYSARAGARTYSGRYAVLGTVAVNKDIIPMGSLLFISSADGSFVYGVAVAADTGAALMQGKAVVDCFFPTYKESLWFGAKTMNVYVLQ